MSSETKTLIVFDTNQLRKTIDNSPNYSSFEFSQIYTNTLDYLTKNELNQNIHLAIPRLVIDELSVQRKNQFSNDNKDISSIIKRMKDIPNCSFDGINLPKKDFDIDKYLKEKQEEFFIKNSFKVIELKEELYPEIFKKTIKRVLDGNKPFSGNDSKNGSDKGFKDAIIFETLLNYESINEYQTVFFFTSNIKDFNKECEKEFEETTNIKFRIMNTYELLIQNLDEIYSNLIENKEIIKLVKTDVFKNELLDALKNEISFEEEIKNIELYLDSIKVIDLTEYKRFDLEEEFEEAGYEKIRSVEIKIKIIFKDESESEMQTYNYLDEISNEVLKREYVI